MTIAMKIKCLPEPKIQFNNGRLDFDPRRALASSGPVDHRGHRTFRLGLIGLDGDVTAARRWLGEMNLYRPAKEKNARRFRDWPGVEKALKAKFEVDNQFVRVIDAGKFDHFFRAPVTGEHFESLVELFEGPISSMYGDVRPDCIVVCVPDELGDLRVENPGLSSKERRALQILKREEESAQFDLFAPPRLREFRVAPVAHVGLLGEVLRTGPLYVPRQQPERSIAVERGPPDTEKTPLGFFALKNGRKNWDEIRQFCQRDLESSRS